VHSGPASAGQLTENATPATASSLLAAKFTLEPGVLGGIESQLATNGVIAGAAVPVSGQALIIAYKLGAHGKLPHTVR